MESYERKDVYNFIDFNNDNIIFILLYLFYNYGLKNMDNLLKILFIIYFVLTFLFCFSFFLYLIFKKNVKIEKYDRRIYCVNCNSGNTEKMEKIKYKVCKKNNEFYVLRKMFCKSCGEEFYV